MPALETSASLVKIALALRISRDRKGSVIMLPCCPKRVTAVLFAGLACAVVNGAFAGTKAPPRSAADHWAFRRVSRPAVPAIKHWEQARTPIDAFVLAALERKNLSLGPHADRATLLRRLTFDLIGLPPKPEEIEQFAADRSPDAYDRAVERLLASPQYGERWGKYWLDVAGYADSNGYFNADTDRPYAYRYRDYVIRSLNSDKPFDEFVREQLAGDELFGETASRSLTPEMVELLTATHYLRNAQDGTSESDGNPDEQRTDRATVLQGALQITMNSLLGITVQCARCHNHKFEPVSQIDYYSLQSVFYPAFPAYDPDRWVKPVDRLRDLSNAGTAPPVVASATLSGTKKKGKAGKRAKKVQNPNAPKLACVTDLVHELPPLRVLIRGNYGDFGPPVVPAGLKVLCDGPAGARCENSLSGLSLDGTPPGICPMADRHAIAGEQPDGPRDRESRLAATLRHGPGRDA